MMRRKKTAQITVRIDSNLKEAAEKAAAKEHRSLTSLIKLLLARYLRNLIKRATAATQRGGADSRKAGAA